jgi:hypothetical protein
LDEKEGNTCKGVEDDNVVRFPLKELNSANPVFNESNYRIFDLEDDSEFPCNGLDG